jgi:uncharacterized protein YifE (UPF0438 family)
MSSRDDHLRLLRRGPFPLPTHVPGLTADERQLLAGCGFRLEALANRVLSPLTEAQQRFVAVAQGRACPVSKYEWAWVKLRPPATARLAPRPEVRLAHLSPEEEGVLRQLRSLLARRAILSGFADSVLRQWEESGQVSPQQLAAVCGLVARVEGRVAVPRVVTGGSRKPGSHRASW